MQTKNKVERTVKKAISLDNFSKTSVLIVGGGTAGWMAAAFFSRQGMTVTLIESAQVPIIGVGESTLPAMTKFCQNLGLEEHQWMPQVNAIHKLGIRHQGWSHNGQDWWHWFVYDRKSQDTHHDYVRDGTLPESIYEYSFHVDATKFGSLVCGPVARQHGCQHIIDDVLTVTVAEKGITGVVTREHGVLTADFYLDCTGFARVLAKAMGIKYHKFEHAINDRAIACHQPALPSTKRYTQTRCLSAGWNWEIALTNRRGAGYVFSRDYISDDAALQEYLTLYPDTDQSRLRFLDFIPSYTETPIVKNMATVGLSSGFLEPLEATSIWLIQYMIEGVHRILTEKRSAQVFNRAQTRVMNEIYEYILFHYTLSERDDNDYWRYYQQVEQKLNTRSIACQRANLPPADPSTHVRLFTPYNWWSMEHFLSKRKN